MTGPSSGIQDTLMRVLALAVMIVVFLWKLLFGSGSQPVSRLAPTLPVRLLCLEKTALDNLLSGNWNVREWIVS
jgi:hypothetical protein